MPELSRFFGIVIRMYFEVGEQHSLPHFHAYYAESAAVFTIDQIELIAGSLPRKQQRLVEAWAEIHQVRLRQAWNDLQSGVLPNAIEPLQ
jgi:hypothetical protein